MNKTKFHEMESLQQAQYMNAWRFVFDAWNCKEWRSLPDNVKAVLRLPANVGVCNSQIVTRTGAQGMSKCVEWLNRNRLITD